jgi:hypothetical protein
MFAMIVFPGIRIFPKKPEGFGIFRDRLFWPVKIFEFLTFLRGTISVPLFFAFRGIYRKKYFMRLFGDSGLRIVSMLKMIKNKKEYAR